MDSEEIGLGEREATPNGGLTRGDALPGMPPGTGGEGTAGHRGGCGLNAYNTAQPTTLSDMTGDRARGLTGMRGV